MQSTPIPSERAIGHQWPKIVAEGLSYLRTGISNICFAADHRGRWCLIDAGMPFYTPAIIDAAQQLFGVGTRPQAIILTHGHFDHVGCILELSRHWDAPVFAHHLEMPFLTGESAYAPPDPTVGGGLMASLSWLYPSKPINLSGRIEELPADGSVPGLSGWRWILTPGHTPGHISLFREQDRALIAGDAFVNVRQESLMAVLTQSPGIHAPPAYFTPDWTTAKRSIERLTALKPLIAITGHGLPLYARPLQSGLELLLQNFDEQSIPRYGRYVQIPAVADEHGIVAVPPDVVHPVQVFLGGVAVGFMLSTLIGLGRKAQR